MNESIKKDFIVMKDEVYDNLSKDTNRLSHKNFKKVENLVDKGSTKKIDVKIWDIRGREKIALADHWLSESNVNGHYLTKDGIQHMINDHWSDVWLKWYEYTVTKDDINKIPEIIKAPDDVYSSPYLTRRQKRKAIVYEKTMDGKKYYYIESYSPRLKRFESHTMYINKI